MRPRLLVVDDEELIRWSLAEDLTGAGYAVRTAQSAAEALALVEREAPDVVLTDLRLGGRSGLALLKAVRRDHPAVPVVLMTAFADLDSAVAALREGAADYIAKPLQLDGLKITLERVLETAALRSRLKESRRRRRDKYSFASFVAESPAMREALALARRLAASPRGHVLVLGEAGCGRRRLARAIHYDGVRAEGPFVELHCNALPERVLEEELFGGRGGGGRPGKKGLLEAAAGGTLFLDEVARLPAGAQARLLRALEEDGSGDARVIAASREDLETAAAEGRFRADLLDRLAVLAVRLKPLRERREDILPLAERLLDALARELGRPRPELPPETRAAFASYAWPGNVRQLRNVVERMLLLGDTAFCPDGAPAVVEPGTRPAGFALPEEGVVLEELEKALVAQAMERAHGNQLRAAQLLGLSRDALRRRLEKFGLREAPLPDRAA